ncbi:MAG: antibiotic biosynthesis monooxygenase [Parabacteroides sp.]|nr:antibiotic biosynthesis monooxygenase [Parabacteroides sp.]
MKSQLLTLVLVVSSFIPAMAQNVSDLTARRGQLCPGGIRHVMEDSPADNLVRLSKITVDPAQLDTYNAYLKEEIEASMRLELGVLTLYAMAEKEHPNKITILEIYANQEAYKSHIQTPHFLKYKQGTLDMVQDLELLDMTPLIPGLKIK